MQNFDHNIGFWEKRQFFAVNGRKSQKIGIITSTPGANPTIAGYNASVENFYNATGSLARFENKTILFYFEKRSRLLRHWRCSC
jgi:hypothetical protein